MKKYIEIAIIIFLMGISPVFSQQGGHVSIQYDMSFGTGDLGDFISTGSFRGASIQYRYPATDNILIGGDLGWNVFYEKRDRDSYTIDTRTLSGIQHRYQNAIPILVSADYSFLPDNEVKPYAGIGVGTMYTERVVNMGTWVWVQNPWHFAIKGEAGLMYELQNGFTFKLAGKYYNAFKAGDLEDQGYFTVSVGAAFSL
ncbi:MAG: outer membrane beta-barrel protein [Bacteroidales bacterium]|nr:outer membrane beta-barrel protein [Bacteroidales bacterium]